MAEVARNRVPTLYPAAFAIEESRVSQDVPVFVALPQLKVEDLNKLLLGRSSGSTSMMNRYLIVGTCYSLGAQSITKCKRARAVRRPLPNRLPNPLLAPCSGFGMYGASSRAATRSGEGPATKLKRFSRIAPFFGGCGMTHLAP